MICDSFSVATYRIGKQGMTKGSRRIAALTDHNRCFRTVLLHANVASFKVEGVHVIEFAQLGLRLLLKFA
ncbi:MAG: hypothetical protein ACSLEM_04425 [Candidatus Malihini olakiniferum]